MKLFFFTLLIFSSLASAKIITGPEDIILGDEQSKVVVCSEINTSTPYFAEVKYNEFTGYFKLSYLYKNYNDNGAVDTTTEVTRGYVSPSNGSWYDGWVEVIVKKSKKRNATHKLTYKNIPAGIFTKIFLVCR